MKKSKEFLSHRASIYSKGFSSLGCRGSSRCLVAAAQAFRKIGPKLGLSSLRGVIGMLTICCRLLRQKLESQTWWSRL